MNKHLSDTNSASTGSVLKDLCVHLCAGLDSSDVAKTYRSAATRLACFDLQSVSDLDESIIVRNIKDKITASINNVDATNTLPFESLHRTIIRSSTLKNPSAILTFLMKMGESDVGSKNSNKKGLNQPNLSNHSKLFSHSSGYVSQSSRGIMSETAAPMARVGSVTPNSSVEQLFPYPGGLQHLQTESVNSYSVTTRRPRHISESSARTSVPERPTTVPRIHSRQPLTPTSSSAVSGRFEASETLLIQDLILCFQGIKGSVIKQDSQYGFKLDPLARVPQPHLVCHVMELGYLHNRVRSLCDQQGEKGTVAQGLVWAIRSQLSEYYRLVASLHSELQQGLYINEDSPLTEEIVNYPSLTLRKVFLWSKEPLQQLQCVCDVVQACNNKSGGAIISAISSYLHHGDPMVQNIVTFLLSAAIKPLFILICHWMIDGQLLDPYDEFFIAVNQNCPNKDRWRHKFVLRESLVPSMINKKQAELILNTGKYINFLCDFCQERMSLSGNRQKLRNYEQKPGEDLLEIAEPGSELWNILENTFLETSRLILDVLINQFKLFQHFRGLRLYMLLGQGDFYRYFLELLHPELKKSATVVYHHNLVAIMETAIRQTNAQFEDPDIIDRVCVKLLEPSGGDDGWDVFNMGYNVAPPLDSIFCSTEQTYSQMFNFLWRLKRVNLSLSHIWKNQASFLKLINKQRKKFRELVAVTVQVRILTGEMLHYLHQVEYYIMFEVLECAWCSFSSQFQQAVSLEQVIDAHEQYLNKIMSMTFQDSVNQQFATQFRVMNELVLELHRLAEDFLTSANEEYERKIAVEKRIEEVGTDYLDQQELLKCEEDFYSTLASFRARTRLLTQSYQDVLKKLLLDLSSHPEINLQLLSSRLDFNEFYKRSDSRLSESMKFRRSSDFVTFSGTALYE